MSLKPDIENILIQLGYSVNDATKNQLSSIIENTPGFEEFAKHIFSLQDELKKFNATVAMSNSHNYLKLKCDSKDEEEIKAFEDIIKNWSNKYKIKLEKVEGKNTYYILGKND